MNKLLHVDGHGRDAPVKDGESGFVDPPGGARMVPLWMPDTLDLCLTSVWRSLAMMMVVVAVAVVVMIMERGAIIFLSFGPILLTSYHLDCSITVVFLDQKLVCYLI